MRKTSSKEMTEQDAVTIDKWIFILLALNNFEGITGRIRMTKEFFIIAKEHILGLWESAEFYPYHFGPYSTRLAVRMNELSRQGYIGASLSATDWKYHLTDMGRAKSELYLANIDNVTKKFVAQIKRKHKRQGLRTFLKEIYEKYPEFALRSVIAPTILKGGTDNEDLSVDDSPGFVACQKVDDEGIRLRGKIARRFLECLGEK